MTDTDDEATRRHEAAALIEGDRPEDPPPGFRRIPSGPGFNQLFGGVWARVEGPRLVVGMRVTERHINPHLTCHGGVLSTFADFMAYAAQYESGLLHTLTPTVSTSIDFLAPAMLGDWLEARCQVLRRTRNLLFCQTLATVDDRAIFRSSTIYKLGRTVTHVGSTIATTFAPPQ